MRDEHNNHHHHFLQETVSLLVYWPGGNLLTATGMAPPEKRTRCGSPSDVRDRSSVCRFVARCLREIKIDDSDTHPLKWRGRKLGIAISASIAAAAPGPAMTPCCCPSLPPEGGEGWRGCRSPRSEGRRTACSSCRIPAWLGTAGVGGSRPDSSSSGYRTYLGARSRSDRLHRELQRPSIRNQFRNPEGKEETDGRE